MFEISNLVCTYDQKTTVLSIPSLHLERGKIYFFIGASGVGKSTLLETLGMMNYPVMSDQGDLWFVKDGVKKSIHEQWRKTDNELSTFRQEHFSFIFQNTNLMPHFIAGENMCYTLLLEGMSWEEASAKVKSLMPSLSLDLDLFDRPVQQLSGGQRQRLAFVRAFVSSFDVLFGDEPTGNLDPVTAAGLMNILRDYIKKNNKTAIIVSHDIPLASNFADKIFYLTKGTDNNGGVLTQNQYFELRNEKWYHDQKEIEGDIISTLHQYL